MRGMRPILPQRTYRETEGEEGNRHLHYVQGILRRHLLSGRSLRVVVDSAVRESRVYDVVLAEELARRSSLEPPSALNGLGRIKTYSGLGANIRPRHR